MLLLLLLSAFTHPALAEPESWADWMSRTANAVAVQATDAAQQLFEQGRLLGYAAVDTDPMKAQELELPRRCANMSDAAYLDSASNVRAALAMLGRFELLKFVGQPVRESASMFLTSRIDKPQWYAARRESELYIVFRGTWSLSDAMRDVVAVPSSYEGCSFHRGFLHGVLASTELLEWVEHEVASYDTVYVVGHSLGGSLAATLVASGHLSRARFAHVLTFGSPAVMHGRCAASWLRAERVRFDSYIYGADVVPRLLGSELPLLKAAYLALAPEALRSELSSEEREGGRRGGEGKKEGREGEGRDEEGSRAAPRAERFRQLADEAFETLTGYVQLPYLRLHWIDPQSGFARWVPPTRHEAVLHIHQAASLNAGAHHAMYAAGLRRAALVIGGMGLSD